MKDILMINSSTKEETSTSTLKPFIPPKPQMIYDKTNENILINKLLNNDNQDKNKINSNDCNILNINSDEYSEINLQVANVNSEITFNLLDEIYAEIEEKKTNRQQSQTQSTSSSSSIITNSKSNTSSCSSSTSSRCSETQVYEKPSIPPPPLPAQPPPRLLNKKPTSPQIDSNKNIQLESPLNHSEFNYLEPVDSQFSPRKGLQFRKQSNIIANTLKLIRTKSLHSNNTSLKTRDYEFTKIVEISEPKLISQTFDLAKQNLIQIQKQQQEQEITYESSSTSTKSTYSTTSYENGNWFWCFNAWTFIFKCMLSWCVII